MTVLAVIYASSTSYSSFVSVLCVVCELSSRLPVARYDLRGGLGVNSQLSCLPVRELSFRDGDCAPC